MDSMDSTGKNKIGESKVNAQLHVQKIERTAACKCQDAKLNVHAKIGFQICMRT